MKFKNTEIEFEVDDTLLFEYCETIRRAWKTNNFSVWTLERQRSNNHQALLKSLKGKMIKNEGLFDGRYAMDMIMEWIDKEIEDK